MPPAGRPVVALDLDGLWVPLRAQVALMVDRGFVQRGDVRCGVGNCLSDAGCRQGGVGRSGISGSLHRRGHAHRGEGGLRFGA